MAQWGCRAQSRSDAPRAFGEQRPDAFALADRADGGEQSFAVAESQPEFLRLRQQALLVTLYGPRDRAARADRIEPVAIAQAGGRRTVSGSLMPHSGPSANSVSLLEALVVAGDRRRRG